MRRLARHLFTLGSFASLLLSVAAGALWVRSQRAMDVWIKETPWQTTPGVKCRQTVFSSTVGQLNVIRSGTDGDQGSWRLGLSGGDGRWHFRTGPASWHVFGRYSVNRFGFAWGLDRERYDAPGSTVRDYQWFVSLPHGFVAAALAVAPALWFRCRLRERRRRYRAARNLCVRCGYDLRGSPGRCPECGAAAASSPEPAQAEPAA